MYNLESECVRAGKKSNAMNCDESQVRVRMERV